MYTSTLRTWIRDLEYMRDRIDEAEKKVDEDVDVEFEMKEIAVCLDKAASFMRGIENHLTEIGVNSVPLK